MFSVLLFYLSVFGYASHVTAFAPFASLLAYGKPWNSGLSTKTMRDRRGGICDKRRDANV